MFNWQHEPIKINRLLGKILVWLSVSGQFIQVWYSLLLQPRIQYVCSYDDRSSDDPSSDNRSSDDRSSDG